MSQEYIDVDEFIKKLDKTIADAMSELSGEELEKFMKEGIDVLGTTTQEMEEAKKKIKRADKA